MSPRSVILVLCLTQASLGNLRHSRIKVNPKPAPLITKDEVCSKSQVEISVSCELSKSTSRRLVVSWTVPSVESTDRIALYLTDPDVNLTAPVFTLNPSSSHGWSHTTLHEVYVDYTDIFTPLCLGYWVIYWRGHEKIASSCLQTQPSWMHDHREVLGRFRLTELFLPGTHDSASYSVVYQPCEQTRYEKYVYTQEESVLSQLLNGIRYLDLRVGYDKKSKNFYAHHDFVKLQNFQGVIDDITMFLNNSNDIVIMDLHRFPVGFSSEEIHLEFISLIEQQLDNFMATPALSWHASLRDIWKTGKKLIVSYNNEAIVSRRTHKLWNPVSQRWGDVRTVQALKEYLEPIMMRRPVGMWAAMAELTPDHWDVLLDRPGGLRAMAADTNHHVTHWLRGWSAQCNIVAVDFFRSSGVVSAAIKANLLKTVDSCH